jgi:hypothetical protein
LIGNTRLYVYTNDWLGRDAGKAIVKKEKLLKSDETNKETEDGTSCIISRDIPCWSRYGITSLVLRVLLRFLADRC